MDRPVALALAKAGRWLERIEIAADDAERHVLRLFGMVLARAPRAALKRCARAMPGFTWFHYGGDPVPALIVHHALAAFDRAHPSLTALHAGYRAQAAELEGVSPLLLSLLGSPPRKADETVLTLPSTIERIDRTMLLELCRTILVETAAGSRRVRTEGPIGFVALLALSYARDWDFDAACALLRSAAYLGCADLPAARWTREWLLDQQHADGRFGLVEQMQTASGGDDYRRHFDQTIQAVWSLSEGATGAFAGVPIVEPVKRSRKRHRERQAKVGDVRDRPH